MFTYFSYGQMSKEKEIGFSWPDLSEPQNNFQTHKSTGHFDARRKKSKLF